MRKITVRKIDILEEQVELPATGHQYWDLAFMEHPFDVRPFAPPGSFHRDEEEGVTIEERVYELREVTVPKQDGSMNKDRFLIPVDQNGIFNQLLAVTEHDIVNVVMARTQNLEAIIAEERRGRQKAVAELESIKRLPWYKKLAL